MAFDDAEVAAGVRVNFLGRVGLETEHPFEQEARGGRADGQVQEVAAGPQHARKLRQPLAERNVFERAARGDEVEGVVGEREGEQVGL